MKIFTHKKPQEATAHGLTALMATERPHLLRYACYRLGNPDDAQDAVQDTFLLLHNRQQDAHGQPLFQPRHYLYRCLSNICTDRLRRHQTRQFIPLEQAIHLCDEQPDDFEQEFRKITTLLAAIPDEQAEVIRLRIHGDNSFTDIAAILELPVSTVKSRFQYGIEKIRKGIYAKSQTL